MGAATAEEIRATVQARLETLGAAATVAPSETIGALEPTMAATEPSALLVHRTAELPRISVQFGEPAHPGAPARAAPRDLEVLGLLGAGGMGKVLLARQHSLDRDVAIKTAHDDAGPGVNSALLREGRIAGRLEHPAIVPVHALGTDDEGRALLVMKRIEGVGWDRLLATPEHESWADWEGESGDRLEANLTILESICNAVRFAHSRGVVHRDIKPENVLIGRFGDVYLADWGIATQLGSKADHIAGTPGFMAPEMIVEGTLDARTDVYLLGATLHLLLTGAPRHDGESLAEALAQALSSEPARYAPTVPAELGQLANAACAADPSERPADPLAFRERLREFRAKRAARSIAAEAAQRLPRIEELTAAGSLEPHENDELERITAEARFGLEQARQTLSHDPELARHWTRFSATLEARRARTAELERIAREGSRTIGAGARAALISVLAVLSIAVSVAAWLQDEEPSPAALFSFVAVIGAVMLAGSIGLRETLLRNTFSRVLSAAVAFPIGAMVIGRGIGLFVPIALSEQFTRELFMITVSCALAAVVGARYLFAVAAVTLAGAILIILFPEHALPTFATSSGAGVLIGLVFAHRDSRLTQTQ